MLWSTAMGSRWVAVASWAAGVWASASGLGSCAREADPPLAAKDDNGGDMEAGDEDDNEGEVEAGDDAVDACWAGAEPVPLMRITPASKPGPWTVLVWTMESYCS